MIQVVGKKHYVAKVLLAISEIFLQENNNNYNSNRFSYKFAFIFFLSFLTNQKQKQVGDVVTKNIYLFFFLFIVSRALLHSHAEFYRLL